MNRNSKAFRKNAKKRMDRPSRMEEINNGFLKAQNFFFSLNLKLA